MSNAPFKIAFWMMSLAFGLTVLLAALKPNEIRLALNPDQHPPEENHLDLDEYATELTATPALPTAKTITVKTELVPTPIPEKYVRVGRRTSQPIRVASADVDATLGLSDWSVEQELELIPIPDKRFALSRDESTQKLTIPVPAPIDVAAIHRVSLNDELSELKGNVLRLKLAEARREFNEVHRSKVHEEIELVEEELAELRTQIRKFKKTKSVIVEVEQVAEVPTPQDDNQIQTSESRSEEVAEVLPSATAVETADFESVVEVTVGETEETYRFRFENARISDVLETLGKYGGRKVVLSPGVSGIFTGEFEETTANQAFAAVIKANQFGLSFRGDYVLVRAERNSKIR